MNGLLLPNWIIFSLPFERPAEFRLNQLLNQLRITATIHKIPEWKNNSETPRNKTLLKNLTRNSDNESSTMTEENLNRSKLYMQRYCIVINLSLSCNIG